MCPAPAPAKTQTLKLSKCTATEDSITIYFSDDVISFGKGHKNYKHSALNPDNYMVLTPGVPPYPTLQRLALQKKMTIQPVADNGATIPFEPKTLKLGHQIIVLVSKIQALRTHAQLRDNSSIDALVSAPVSGPLEGEITGTLVDENNQPFVNRRVHMHSETGHKYEVQTDEKGHFRRPVPKGRYHVFADEDELGLAVPVLMVDVK